ncbi:hypothetical protein F5883DRAFT_224846 [Diaporthe sp. PMI_573]|nr:hypothetical protein F5883DRAFT_224846 [Diaporthaceae sp. PMI_573]
MGMVHQIRVIAMVDGIYRVIDALAIPSDDPSSDKLTIATQALLFFQANQELIDLELARAATLPDVEWSPKSKEAKKDEENEEDEEDAMACVPQFQLVRLCLLLAALGHDKHSFMYRLLFEAWNAKPDDGGKWMWETGCTFVNLTDHSVAFVVPSHQACGRARKSTYDGLKLRALSGEQYLTAFGHEHEYYRPVQVKDIYGYDRAASIMPLKTIQKVWPEFPPTYEESKKHEEEKEEDEEWLAQSYSSCHRIFRDKTQHTNDTGAETKNDKRGVPVEEKERKLVKIQALLTSYTNARLSSHKFDDDFPTLVRDFVRENAESLTPTMPGTVPLILTALGYQPRKLCHVPWLDLSRFPGLPGDTVVELVRAVVDGNRAFQTKKRKRDENEPLAPLELLDVSFNHGVTPEHMASVLKMTRLDEFRFWDNPGLAGVAWDGRIAKLTSRERFLEPLQRLAAWQATWRSRRRGNLRIQPAPPMAPTPARIRQLVWTTLKTRKIWRNKPPTAVVDWLQLPPQGSVSLAQLDAGKLAWILHPRFRRCLERVDQKAHVFAEAVSFPLHDVRAPRHEIFTSAARFEKSMTSKKMVRSGHDTLGERWPLKLPLEIVTGCERDRYAITSPLPAELFPLAWEETVGNDSYEKRMRQHGFDAIVPGEYTIVLLHEVDPNIVHYALVTCGPDGQPEARDPAAVARELGDERAALAWERGFPATQEVDLGTLQTLRRRRSPTTRHPLPPTAMGPPN